MHKLSRREVLRGAGVAALSVGAAVVPFAARAMCDSAPGVADDPRLFDLAESAVIKIRNVRKLDRLTQSKWEKCWEGLPAGWAVDGPANAEFERRAEAVGYNVAYKRWCSASEDLVHDVLEMTNLPALTVRGLAAKALVVSLVMKAWRCDGGEIWEHVRYSDKLLASLLRESAEAGVREAGGPVNRTDILFGPREKNARAQALG